MKKIFTQLMGKRINRLINLLILLVFASAISQTALAQSPLCSSSPTLFGYEYVSSVSINGQVRQGNTGYSGPGYMDFSASSITNLVAGNTYPVSVTVVTNSTWHEYVKIWFDFNGNLNLQDPGELIFNQDHSWYGTHTFSGNITVPANAYNGTVFLRIIMVYAAVPQLCGNYSYGNTMDFKATISGGVTPKTLTVAKAGMPGYIGNVVSSPAGINTAAGYNSANFSEGSTVTLTASNAAGGTFVNWTGDAAGTNPSVAVNMNANKNVTANFAANIPSDPTSISASANPICNGTATQLTANGALGTVYWYSGSCGGTLVGTGNTISVSPGSTTAYYARNYNNGQFSNGCASTTITVNTAPTILCSSNITVNSTPGLCGANVSYPAATASGSPAPTISYSHASGSFFPSGSTTVTATATNSCGSTSCTFVVKVIDTQAPVISCPFNITVNATPGVCGAVVNYNSPAATDNCGSNTLPTSISGYTFKGNYNGHAYFMSNSMATPETAHANAIALGGHLVTINSAAENAFVSAMSPSNYMWIGYTDRNVEGTFRWITDEPVTYTNWAGGEPNNAGGNEDWAVINWGGSAMWNDWYYTVSAYYVVEFSGGSVPTTLLTGLGSGATFPIGVSTETWQATDQAGNVSTCSFTVTVVDNIAPTVVTQNITVQLNSSGTATITAAQVNNGSSDNCSISSLTLNKTSFSCANVGANTVTLTATDPKGNSSSANATVTVSGPDDDNDGVINACDLDDDNDGIPDAVECNQSNFFWSNPPTISGNTATGTINGIGYTYTSSSPVTTTTSMYSHATFPSSYNVPNSNPTIQNIYVTSNTLTFASPMTNPVLVFASIGNGGQAVPISFGAPIQVVWSTNVVQNSSTQITGTEGYAIIRMMGTFTSISFNYQAAENWCNFAFGADFQSCGDTDNDGTPNYLDTDSDNDGCPDAIEGSMHFALNQTLNGRLTGGVSSQGIPTIAGAGQGVGTSANYIANCFCQPDIDKTPPVALAQNVIVQLDASGNGSTTAELVNNGSSDDCGIKTLALSKTAFSCADIATSPNVVTLTVTDNNNNVSTTTANVTVVDAIAPVALAQNVTVQLDASGNGSTTAELVNNGSNDACGIQSLALSKTAFSCSDIATNPNIVTLTVTDKNGNVSTTTANVTVVDAIAPIALARNVIVQLDASGNGITTAGLVNDGSNDACGIQSLALSKTAFSCSDIATNPNTVTLTVTDNNGNVSTASATVTVKDQVAPVISCKVSTSKYVDPYKTYYTISGAEIDATATDACGIQSLTYVLTGATTGSGTLMSGIQLNLGTNTIVWTAIDVNGNSSVCTTVVTVIKRPTTLTYSGNIEKQYSDRVDLSAILVDNVSTDGVTGMTITFTIGTQSTTAVTNSSGVATATLVITQAPGNYTVTSSYAGDGSYLPSADSDGFTITREDARVNFTGTSLVATASATSGSATVTLRATVQDISATSDAGGDTYPGDIRNARVKFTKDGTDLTGWLTPTLVSSADLKTGVVTYNWAVNIGNAATYEVYTIGIVVDNYYTRDNSTDNTVVTVYKPTGDFITGGGYIVPGSAAGTYASDPGLKTNFGFNVGYNKSGKNIHGHMNIIFRRTVGGVVHTYQIKANAMTSLGVNLNSPAAKTAVFVSKGNLTDITNQSSPQGLGGNLTLQVNLTDKGEPGSSDQIAISLYDGSSLLYSSNWAGSNTQEMLLTGGNLVVHSGFSLNSAVAPTTFKSASLAAPVEPVFKFADLKVYPNPFIERVRFEFVSPESVDAQIDIYDMIGRKIATIFEGPIEEGVVNTAEFKPQTIDGGMYTYRAALGAKVFTGKILHKK